MVTETLKERAKLVDAEIEKVLDKLEPKKLYEPMKYHLFAGGKRIRPVLCMLSCEAVSFDSKKALPVAAALELVHAFTLVHDDIMDRDDLRRGRETVFKKYGEAFAINVGDGIFTKAYESALSLKIEPEKRLEILEIMTQAILDVCEGQTLDMEYQEKDELSMNQYLEMSTRKTASLIEASARIGAIVGNGSKEEVEALAKYGKKLGLAFQIWDDYIDFSSEKTGKTRGSDIQEGKKTLIVCHAFTKASPSDKHRLMEILRTPSEETNEELIAEAITILGNNGSIEYAKNYAKDLVNDAKRALNELKDSKAKKDLLEFADFIVSREV